MSDGNCLSDFLQLPGAGGSGDRPGLTKTWNQPHLSLGDHAVDLCVEKYAAEGLVEDKEAQKVIAKYFMESPQLVYGEIPQGDVTFSSKDFPGDVLVYDNWPSLTERWDNEVLIF